MITNGFTYVGFLLFVAAFLIGLERLSSGTRFQKIFKLIPSVVLLYLVCMLLCTFGVWDLKQTKGAYSALKNNLTYTMVFVMLLRCDIRRIIKMGPRMVMGFLTASITIIIGFIVAYLSMKKLIGADAWKGLGALCGSWLGGSGNMVAVQAALNISEADMGYALVIDSIDYSLWVVFLLWAIHLAPVFNSWTKSDTTVLDTISTKLMEEDAGAKKSVTFQSLIFLLGLSLLASSISGNIGIFLNKTFPWLDKATWTILTITVMGLLFALTFVGKIAGTVELSNILLYAVIGLLASRASLTELKDAPYWIVTGFIVLIVHGLLMTILSKLFKLDMFTSCVASLANIGGTASAPVLAGSYAGSLVPVGILMALMGYVIGTPCGILTAHILKSLSGM